MNKISRYMQNYLLYGFIFVIALLSWSVLLAYFSPLSVIANSNIVIRIIHEVLSYNLMCWFLTLVIYMIFLVVVPEIRDKTLRRLANLKERDEREEYITGKAARSAYIATLSLMLFFLFFSLIDINLSKLPQTNFQKPGYSVSLNVHYSFFNELGSQRDVDKEAKTLFDSKNFSLSNSTLILIILGWQLLVFNFVARRENLKDL